MAWLSWRVCQSNVVPSVSGCAAAKAVRVKFRVLGSGVLCLGLQVWGVLSRGFGCLGFFGVVPQCHFLFFIFLIFQIFKFSSFPFSYFPIFQFFPLINFSIFAIFAFFLSIFDTFRFDFFSCVLLFEKHCARSAA